MTECTREVSLVESGHKGAKPHGLVGCLAGCAFPLDGREALGLPVSSEVLAHCPRPERLAPRTLTHANIPRQDTA